MTLESAAETPTHESDLGLNPDFVREILDALDGDNASEVRKLVAELDPPDVADLLAVVRPHERSALLHMLGNKLDRGVWSAIREHGQFRDQLAANGCPAAWPRS